MLTCFFFNVFVAKNMGKPSEMGSWRIKKNTGYHDLPTKNWWAIASGGTFCWFGWYPSLNGTSQFITKLSRHGTLLNCWRKPKNREMMFVVLPYVNYKTGIPVIKQFYVLRLPLQSSNITMQTPQCLSLIFPATLHCHGWQAGKSPVPKEFSSIFSDSRWTLIQQLVELSHHLAVGFIH